MIYAEVETALNAVVASVSGIPNLTHENTLFDAKGKATTAYSRTTLLPSEAVPATVGINGKNEYFGLYQIDLFYPLHAGKSAANAMADLVVAAYARQIILTGTSKAIEVRAAWCETGTVEQQHYRLPVVIRWRIRI